MGTSFSGFQLYERDVKRYIDAISLTRSNQIGFPTSMFKEHELGKYESAFLYWNPETQEIGVEFTNEKDKRAFNVTRSKNYGGYISARNFLLANKIDPTMHADRYSYRIVKLQELGVEREGEMYIFRIQPHKNSSAANLEDEMIGN